MSHKNCSCKRGFTELNKLPINDDSELIIVGDFNLPDVNWFSGNLKVCSDTTDRNLLNQLKFMDLFVQKGLTWHIKDQITRRRLVNGSIFKEFPSRINVGSVIDI